MTANCRRRAKGNNLRMIMCFAAGGAIEAASGQIVEHSTSCSSASAIPRHGKRRKDRGIGHGRAVRRPDVNLFRRLPAGRAAKPDSGCLPINRCPNSIGENAAGVLRLILASQSRPLTIRTCPSSTQYGSVSKRPTCNGCLSSTAVETSP